MKVSVDIMDMCSLLYQYIVTNPLKPELTNQKRRTLPGNGVTKSNATMQYVTPRHVSNFFY
jgi:hypothetical protein